MQVEHQAQRTCDSKVVCPVEVVYQTESAKKLHDLVHLKVSRMHAVSRQASRDVADMNMAAAASSTVLLAAWQ